MSNKSVPLLRVFITLSINFPFYFYFPLPNILEDHRFLSAETLSLNAFISFLTLWSAVWTYGVGSLFPPTMTIGPCSVHDCETTELGGHFTFYSLTVHPVSVDWEPRELWTLTQVLWILWWVHSNLLPVIRMWVIRVFLLSDMNTKNWTWVRLKTSMHF